MVPSVVFETRTRRERLADGALRDRRSAMTEWGQEAALGATEYRGLEEWPRVAPLATVTSRWHARHPSQATAFPFSLLLKAGLAEPPAKP